ncbi:S1 family peptidase [Plantactinospora sp. CA-290183]|uniref:S1 family peptidase n=1 Tax=Plantactinospora sp. CA-290183 TaxID=3240006 RepID=UPI003D8BE741
MPIRRALAVFAAALAGALVAPSAASATPAVPFIIGGGTVSSASWAAAVYSGYAYRCSGTLISSRWVLTARHCVSGNMSVNVGNVYAGRGAQHQVISTHTRNDVALLMLDWQATGAAARLAGSDPAVGSTGSIYGWGLTCEEGCDRSSQLKTASVRVTRLDAQDRQGGRAIESAGVNGYAWSGDSGGPMFHDGAVVGVASTVLVDAATGAGLGVQNYSSVAANRAWIRSVSGV